VVSNHPRWALTIVSEELIETELALGGWTDAVMDSIRSLPVVLGEGEYRRLMARGPSLSDDDVVAYLSAALDELERDQA